MGIKAGQEIEADTEMNAYAGMNFKNYSNLIWNADLNGFNSNLNQDFKNLFYSSLFSDDSQTLRAKSPLILEDSTFLKYPLCPRSLIDEHDDSLIDSNLWTTSISGIGSISENSNCMILSSGFSTNVNGSATAILNGTSAPDLRTISSILIRVRSTHSQTVGSDISITDGSNSIELIYRPGEDKVINYRINVDVVGKTAKITSDLNDTEAVGVNLSLLNENVAWRLMYRTLRSGSFFSGSAGCTMEVYITSSLLPEDESSYIFGTHESDENITNAILSASKVGTEGVIYELSADDGANWEEVSDATIHRFTNIGTDLKFRATSSASDDAYPEISELKHFAVVYNWYSDKEESP